MQLAAILKTKIGVTILFLARTVCFWELLLFGNTEYLTLQSMESVFCFIFDSQLPISVTFVTDCDFCCIYISDFDSVIIQPIESSEESEEFGLYKLVIIRISSIRCGVQFYTKTVNFDRETFWWKWINICFFQTENYVK